MPYVAPLRHAVLHCAEEGRPFSAQLLASLGNVTKPSRARAYAEQLVRCHFLKYAGETGTGEQLYDRGQYYMSWAKRETRTKPGGHRKRTYRAVARTALPALSER